MLMQLINSFKWLWDVKLNHQSFGAPLFCCASFLFALKLHYSEKEHGSIAMEIEFRDPQKMVNSAHLHFRIPRLPFRLQHDRKLHSVSSANGKCLWSTRRFSREFRVMSWQISHCSHLSLNIELAIFISQAVIVIINHWALIFRREEFKDGEGSCVS